MIGNKKENLFFGPIKSVTKMLIIMKDKIKVLIGSIMSGMKTFKLKNFTNKLNRIQ